MSIARRYVMGVCAAACALMFAGSAAMGLLYDRSHAAVAALPVIAALQAFIPLRQAMNPGR